MRLIGWADGASRGNPGPAAWGMALATPAGEELAAEGRAIGRATNNVAEYRGAIAAAEAALALGADELELRLDSQLVVRQLEGRYRVKHRDLKPLFERLSGLAGQFAAFRAVHVPRERNRRADALANAALDAGGRAGPDLPA